MGNRYVIDNLNEKYSLFIYILYTKQNKNF